jgi:glycerophosphoryl diester phosphodiesterase
VIGHRGVRGAAPENTIAAFETALREGAQAIELDVRLCACGAIVVFHDPTLARVTHDADRRAIADLCYAELRRVDTGESGPVPLLGDALAFARTHGLWVNIEIKHDCPDRRALALSTARLLRAWDPSHPLLVSSFDPAIVLWMRALVPSIPRALLVHRDRYHPYGPWIAARLGTQAVHIERTIASPEYVRRLQAKGLIINVWTVNDAREARDLAAIGVDGLITDVPGEIRAALQPPGAD